MEAKAIRTTRYLNKSEIKEHLKNVEFIIMAAPSPEQFKESPIHFTIFLNTSDNLPKDIQDAILDKFLDENGIQNPIEMMSQIMPVGFSEGSHETLMPLLLIKKEDMVNIPSVPLFVFDFLADSENFYEAKEKSLTGWSYSYSD
ncbi:hypothetical protein FCU45_07090 [Sulfurimonas crateris]|uniref:Uncharacterized protein n=1 Tax=Sulfurimonas crateris TaxID=2574727 RepID=A0A4U2Z523_9BACT|nr:hypothetical protein [Sulfurimonas crateris]TKI69278.1 hypothetical protein FCU45_07090 [Sulfurimonas crateris]